MPGKIPKCNFKNGYTLLFITVERDRTKPKLEQRQKLVNAVSQYPFKNNKILLAVTSEEISDNDYYHHHLIVQFKMRQKVKKFWQHLVKTMHFEKPNQADISVWFGYLPPGDTNNAESMKKYLNEKRYKTSAPDPDGSITFIDLLSCQHCGAFKFRTEFPVCNCWYEMQFNRSLAPNTPGKLTDSEVKAKCRSCRFRNVRFLDCPPHPVYGKRICKNHPKALLFINF